MSVKIVKRSRRCKVDLSDWTLPMSDELTAALELGVRQVAADAISLILEGEARVMFVDKGRSIEVSIPISTESDECATWMTDLSTMVQEEIDMNIDREGAMDEEGRVTLANIRTQLAYAISLIDATKHLRKIE